MAEGEEKALSFERAETESPSVAGAQCATCMGPIRSTYYQRGGAVVCPKCRERALAERARGTPLGRFARATALGAGAAILGAGIWYGIGQLTGYEFGLIAIVIGLLVGGAVRMGSRRRGGWLYQGLAMLLTYTSIVSTYIPAILEAATADDGMETGATLDATDPDHPKIDPVSAAAAPALERSQPAAAPAVEATANDPEVAAQVEPARIGAVGLLVALAALIAILFAAPFLAGFENFMGWIIIAIGLFEAWKLNRREELVFEGPFHVAGARPEYVPEPAPPPIAP